MTASGLSAILLCACPLVLPIVAARMVDRSKRDDIIIGTLIFSILPSAIGAYLVVSIINAA